MNVTNKNRLASDASIDLTEGEPLFDDDSPNHVHVESTTTDFPQSRFNHIKKGNYGHTEKAIEAYLLSQGIPRRSYTAELIMFMEKSFAGKYAKGAREHYQQIMPSERWRKGDTLSEKLTRCKDKETFKGRFDRIGTTAVLKREHFDNFAIAQLDFQGRLYFRLIDTVRNNVSRFYRNDAAVEELIRAALEFYDNQRSPTRRRAPLGMATRGNPEEVALGKAEEVGVGKPEMVYLENPKPLLTVNVNNTSPRDNTRDSLMLVHSATAKKTQKSDQGKEKVGKRWWSEESQLGNEVHKQWRQSILMKDDSRCISAYPDRKMVSNAATLGECLGEFFATSQFPDFFSQISENWDKLKVDLNRSGVWQTLGDYPTIPVILAHSDKILTWYKKQLTDRKATESSWKPAPMPPMVVLSATAPLIPPPLRGCDRKTAPGRTFLVGREESLEYEVAFLVKEASPYGSVRLEQLKDHSIDMAASMSRIRELTEMSDEEFSKYCC